MQTDSSEAQTQADANSDAAEASPIATASAPKPQGFNMNLPGFVVDSLIDFSDAAKHLSSQMGFHRCAGCERRAVAMKAWLRSNSRRTR